MRRRMRWLALVLLGLPVLALAQAPPSESGSFGVNFLNLFAMALMFAVVLAMMWGQWRLFRWLKSKWNGLFAPSATAKEAAVSRSTVRSPPLAEAREPTPPKEVAPPSSARTSADPERARVTPRTTEPLARAATDSIFISYRRQDSADVTGRIYDRLVQRFDRKQIFKDVDSIPLGVDFRAHLGDVVGRCDLLLAIIGPQWLASVGPNGRRLDDASDFVRIEIEAALARNIPVVPILVGGADLPAERELPPSLAALTFRNGIAVRADPDFHRDMDRLIAGLESHHPHHRA